MHSSHKPFQDSELVVDNLGKRGQTVGGAAGIGNNVLIGVLILIDPHDKHGSVFAGGRNHNLLSSTL
jgi:hypothetical protein